MSIIDNAYPVLNTPIKKGGFGRPMTSSEIKTLRKLSGKSISNDSIVVRGYDNENFGIVCFPCKYGSEFEHSGIFVALNN